MWTASINYHIAGDFIHLEETTLRHAAMEHLGDNLFGLACRLTPEWTYKLRWGPKDDDFGIAEKSIGHVMYQFGQWVGGGFGAWKQRKSLARIPVTAEWIRENLPSHVHPYWREANGESK